MHQSRKTFQHPEAAACNFVLENKIADVPLRQL